MFFKAFLEVVGLKRSYSRRSSSTSSIKLASPSLAGSSGALLLDDEKSPFGLGSSVFQDENLLLEEVFGIDGRLDT